MKNEKDIASNYLFSSYLKQFLNYMQILNIINFIEFSHNTDEKIYVYVSDFFSGSLLRVWSLECIFSCRYFYKKIIHDY